MLRTAACLFSISLLGLPATAQRPGETILESVDSVDAQVNLTWDSRIENLRESMIQSRLETVFQLELRQRGIVVTKNAKNLLVTSITLLNVGDGTASYNYQMSLYELGLPDRVIGDLLEKAYTALDTQRLKRLHRTDSLRAELEMRADVLEGFLRAWGDTTFSRGFVTTWWGASGVGHVGMAKLQGALERQTTQLAQEFANAYMASHPTR